MWRGEALSSKQFKFSLTLIHFYTFKYFPSFTLTFFHCYFFTSTFLIWWTLFDFNFHFSLNVSVEAMSRLCEPSSRAILSPPLSIISLHKIRTPFQNFLSQPFSFNFNYLDLNYWPVFFFSTKVCEISKWKRTEIASVFERNFLCRHIKYSSAQIQEQNRQIFVFFRTKYSLFQSLTINQS